MKTLIISEDSTVSDALNNTLRDIGSETIIYRWLLKAMDNLEEISPENIIVSCCDYPRHWKTLVQFVRADLARTKANIILYIPEDFSEDEKAKAKALGITSFLTFKNINDLTLLKSFINFDSIIPNKEMIAHRQSVKMEPVEEVKAASGLLNKIREMYG